MIREFSKEFKRDAVSLVLDQGYLRTEAAKSLDVPPALLGRWVNDVSSCMQCIKNGYFAKKTLAGVDCAFRSRLSICKF